MSTIVEDMGGPWGRNPARFMVAVAVPLGLAALPYALWWISDRLVTIGPLDRAAFGWAVVMPTWIVAPVAAGFVWGRLSPRGGVLAATFVGLSISGIAAALFWLSVAYPDCSTGDIHTPGDWILPSLALGLAIGGGFVISGLIATSFLREGHRLRAVLLSGGAGVLMASVAIAIAVVILVLSGPACQRPV